MARVPVVRRRPRAQRHDCFHVVHVRAGVLSLRDVDVTDQRGPGDVGRAANGRHGYGRHRSDIRQRKHLLHNAIRPPQDVASVW